MQDGNRQNCVPFHLLTISLPSCTRLPMFLIGYGSFSAKERQGVLPLKLMYCTFPSDCQCSTISSIPNAVRGIEN